MITLDDVRQAAERVAPVLRPTPVEPSETFSRLVGRPVLLKPEHLQRTGSFKIRGAYNRVSRVAAGGEVVAASAGNHAQGVALAAARSGLRSTIYMPSTAPLPKWSATRD
ncbi:MAG: pyridoxal-phosphate dependent enzyme, partial [Acidimicrobiales bacterium]